MKFTILCALLSAILYCLGVWISGWEPGRGETGVIVYILGIIIICIAARFGSDLDSCL